MKTLSSYFLTNHQYIKYYCQKNDLGESEVFEAMSKLNRDDICHKVKNLCETYNINFAPYHFTLTFESPQSLQSFDNFFTNMLGKTDMLAEQKQHNGTPFNKVIDLMSEDIDYLLAGIACIQYFFL